MRGVAVAVGWLALGLGGCPPPPAPVDSADTGVDTDTGTDTGPPLPPCPYAGHVGPYLDSCEGDGALEQTASIGEDCVLTLEVLRYSVSDPSPYPPLCTTTERIALRYDDAALRWTATSVEQSENLAGCYSAAPGAYPLGEVVPTLSAGEPLTLAFDTSPWSLWDCAEVVLTLAP